MSATALATADLPAPFVPLAATLVMPKPRTLAEEVLAAGLNVIPLDRVREYQVRMVRRHEAQTTEHVTFLASWERVDDHAIRSLNPPADVAAAINAARDIPRARVHAERFEADPFVFITRRKGSSGQPETVCFAYWDAPGFRA